MIINLFSPNPQKSQAPVFLAPGHRLQVLFKKLVGADVGRDTGGLVTVEVGPVQAMRWKSSAGAVCVALNHDIKTGMPEKYFFEDSGSLELNSGIERISFSNDAANGPGKTLISFEFM